MTSKMIDLTIKTLDSQNHKFRVPDTFTILELKEYIAEQVNVAVVQQRLIFCGRVLSNETKLAEIGIDGKVMHLVQKVPRLSTTTSGSSSTTTTNTNSRSGQNGGSGFRGWHTHDPTVLFGAIGIPSEFMHAGDVPRLMNTRTHGTGNRVSLAIEMIRKSNEILNRLENPQSSGQSSGNLQPEASVSESSVPEPSVSESSASVQPSDPDSVNVSYEVDETFPNTVVVTIDATHHMRMPPALIRHMQNQLRANNAQSTSQSATEQTTESEPTAVPETTPVGSTNQYPGYQPLHFIASDQLRNERPSSENRSSTATNDRRRFKELLDQLNKLNVRLQPFYAIYCQLINEDPQFATLDGENGSQRAQNVFNGVSKVMHYISHVYHAISDLRCSFTRPPPRPFLSRPCLLQGTILHSAHSVTTATAPPPTQPSTQQPTSTQTTSTSQSIPSVRAFRLDFMNPDGTLNPNVSTSATGTETNSNMTVDPNAESNNTSTEFPPETPHGVELMFDLPPGTIRIDSVEAAFVTPNASEPNQPTSVSQPSSNGETSNNLPMPIDWMDQMIDVISSGVRRPFMSEHLDWNSIPTTSTRTPRVTPRTTDSSSTTNPSSQGLNRAPWDTNPRMDPFLPCSSHHFESNLRPMVLARRSTQGTDRSSSSVNSSNSTTDTSSPTSPNEVRPLSGRRSGRPRSRYVQDPDGYLSGIHPILAWGRNLRNNVATTSGTLNGQTAGQNHGLTDSLAGQIRVGMDSAFDTLERERDSDRARRSMRPINIPVLDLQSVAYELSRSPSPPINQILLTPIGDIPYFRDLQGRSIIVDLLLLITRNWTLHDILSVNVDDDSSINLNSASRHNEALYHFFINRVMRNRAFLPDYVEEAASQIFDEIAPYIEIFQCSVPSHANVNMNESFRCCIVQNLYGIIQHCGQIQTGTPNNILSFLIKFCERFLSLVIYCCTTRSSFRLSVMASLNCMPLPAHLHRLLVQEVRLYIDKYWDTIAASRIINLSVVEYLVSNEEAANTSRMINEERSSNPTISSSETSNEPLPEVVIGSQEWHHNVPSEWVPVIARDSQRQRRQGTQPPYSDAYLSGMPNKRRKIVTSSKPQGPLSQIIAKNLEVAMGAAGVAVNKEVTASVGADTGIQNAYTERIKTLGRSGIETHPDFCPDRYPNASKFFYDHNHPN